MNQKNNQRFQETDQRIREYFMKVLEEKEISKITVREICEAVGINRSSFYLHYPDVYALLDRICEETVKKMLEDINSAGIESRLYFSEPYLTVVLKHVREHSALYRAYTANVGMDKIEKGMNSLFEGLFKPYFQKLGMVSEHEMIYYFTFATTGFMAVLQQWLRYGCIESPEEMTRIIMQSVAPIPEGLPGMDGI